MSPSGDISPNVSLFPPGSFHAVTVVPGQIGYFRETSPVPGMGFTVQLTCDADKDWGIPTVYELEVAFRAAPFSANVVYSLTASPGTLLDRASTTGYQTLPNLWKTACYFTNEPGVLHPTITFVYSSGTVSTASPVNIDLLRFIEMTPALPLLYYKHSGSNVVLSWFTNLVPCVLFQSTNLATGWQPVTNSPDFINGLSQLTIEQPCSSSCFYRLQR
jgi:hypothetical protein